jgi:hypothetical protein
MSIPNFIETHPAVLKLNHVDRQTERQKYQAISCSPLKLRREEHIINYLVKVISYETARYVTLFIPDNEYFFVQLTNVTTVQNFDVYLATLV